MVKLSHGTSKLSKNYGITIAALLMLLLASCASQEAMHSPTQGMTAVYLPPVRLGGQGRLIFHQAPAPTPRAPLAGLTADYIPGPWSIFSRRATGPISSFNWRSKDRGSAKR